MRINIYIDNSNFFREIKDSFNGVVKIDYAMLKQQIEKICNSQYGPGNIFTHHVYASERKVGETPQTFFYKKLEYIGYEVCVIPLSDYDNRYTEKGVVDLNLSLDMAVGAASNHYDIGVLIAGDGDYSYLADVVKRYGKVFDLMFPTSSLSDRLRRKAHIYTAIDSEFVKTISMTQRENTDEKENKEPKNST